MRSNTLRFRPGRSAVRTAICLVLFAALPLRAAEPPRASAKALEEQMQKVVEDGSPAVVAIVVSHRKYPGARPDAKAPGRLGGYLSDAPMRQPFGPFLLPPVNKLDLSKPENVADNTFGSGVIVDAGKGLVLTTHHLIDGATKIYVRLSNGDGGYADIQAADARSDFAVLKLLKVPAGLSEAKIAAVQLVDSPEGKKANLRRGSWVIALGHPLAAGFADGQPSASWGILSNVRRRSGVAPQREELRTNKPLHTYGSLLQTDARLTLGSSGTVLLNLDGDVVGLGSTVAAVQGSEASGGYAIPFDANYRRILNVLKDGQEVDYGFLGVAPVTALGGGVEVSGITPGCPAAEADLRNGDILKKIDGHGLKDTDDLLLYVGAALAGTDVTIEFQRRGAPMKATVTLAKMANPLPTIASNPGPSFHGLRADYASVRLIGLLVRNGPMVTPPAGVSVKDLEVGSIAEKKFKEAGEATPGWIITHVNGAPVRSPGEFNRAAGGKASIKLTLADPAEPDKTATINLP